MNRSHEFSSSISAANSSTGALRWYAPILVAEAYLFITVFVCAFGPWPWPIHNPFALYGYLVLAQAALLVGYLSYSRDALTLRTYTGQYSPDRILKISVLLNLVWLYPYFYIQVGSDALSVHSMITHILAGIVSPFQVYKDKLAAASVRENYLLYGYMLFSPLLWLALPLGISRWRSISLHLKVALVVIVAGNCATWLALGTMKGIADSSAIIAVSIAAWWRRDRSAERIRRRGSSFVRSAIALGALAGGIWYFTYQHSDRQSGRVTIHNRDAGIDLNTDNIFLVGLPVPAQIGVSAATAYMTQGYYGLSLALELPFHWSYGIGHSVALTSLMNKIAGFDVTPATYMAREQDSGWDMERRFDSIYPWLASDVTFPGALVVVLLFGRLLAASWADAQSEASPYAFPFFVMMMVVVFYFPANDQVLSASISVFAFWGVLLMWLSTRGIARTRGAPLS